MEWARRRGGVVWGVEVSGQGRLVLRLPGSSSWRKVPGDGRRTCGRPGPSRRWARRANLPVVAVAVSPARPRPRGPAPPTRPCRSARNACSSGGDVASSGDGRLFFRVIEHSCDEYACHHGHYELERHRARPTRQPARRTPTRPPPRQGRQALACDRASLGRQEHDCRRLRLTPSPDETGSRIGPPESIPCGRGASAGATRHASGDAPGCHVRATSARPWTAPLRCGARPAASPVPARLPRVGRTMHRKSVPAVATFEQSSRAFR